MTFIQTPAQWDTKAFTDVEGFPPSLCRAFASHEKAKARFNEADAKLKAELRRYADANGLPFVRPEIVKGQIDRMIVKVTEVIDQ